jgi:UDP-N-acetylmuramoyl-L-alanyl-D-glutamate--2,6-diaminopimelate ligase
MDSSISLPCTFPVTCHTDFVGKGSTFVAIEGYADNGIHYIQHAIEKGARNIIVHLSACLSDELCSFIAAHDVTVQRVENTRKALADLSAQAADFPAKKLKIIGITGTKGKTTTSFLLEHTLRTAGHKTALISSAQNRINGHLFSAPLTTPQPDYLQQFLKLCADNAVEYVVMEVAAQALSLHRVAGITFCGIIFTNFSLEHLEFYPNLDDYFRAKCLIFNQAIKDAPILINRDNNYCAQLLADNNTLQTFGFNEENVDYHAQLLANATHTISLRVRAQNREHNYHCPVLFGSYNAYNVLAATSMSRALNISAENIAAALPSFTGVPGRLQEHFLSNGARCFIDYAHNPESFQAVLSTLRALTEQLIVVFGAGGGRDKSKRPMMGLIAATIADMVIVTSDNPRLEDAATIADDIVDTIPSSLTHKVAQELDRKKAIEYAYQQSHPGSIIALLGKGPDEYQIIGTTKYYFSERNIVEQL